MTGRMLIFVLQMVAAILLGVAMLAPVGDSLRIRLVAAALLALTGSFLVGSYPG